MTSSKQPTGAEPIGLLDQFQRTRESFMALLQAHVALLKAELNDILGEIKIIASQAGILLFFALLTSILLYVGGALFLGEWVFGSIGWGLAHGVLLGIAIMVIMALAIVGARARTAIYSFLLSVLVVVGVAVLCGSNVAYDAVAQASGNLAQPFGAPGVIALFGGIVLGALLFGILFAFVGGAKGAIGGAILGVFLGAIVGWLIAGAPWTWPPAVAFAIMIGLVAWPILAAVFAYPSLDPAARFARLKPQQSIDAANETRAWMEEQWQTRLPKRGNK
jgi:hypothetical protein